MCPAVQDIYSVYKVTDFAPRLSFIKARFTRAHLATCWGMSLHDHHHVAVALQQQASTLEHKMSLSGVPMTWEHVSVTWVHA